MISICLTSFNRDLMTVNAFRRVHDDPRVSEVVIVDDHSNEKWFNNLQKLCEGFSKVKMFRNTTNIGMAQNKARALELATSDWCILFDSDNELDKKYLDKLSPNDTKTIYMPSFAMPTFDYSEFSSLRFSAENVAKHIDKRMFDCLLNTCNYVVNRHEYLKVYEYDHTIKATDTIAFNYRWLLAGNEFYVVPGLHYFHRVHNGSGFMADAGYNMQKAEEFKNLIRCL